jgi:hypothetical protein
MDHIERYSLLGVQEAPEVRLGWPAPRLAAIHPTGMSTVFSLEATAPVSTSMLACMGTNRASKTINGAGENWGSKSGSISARSTEYAEGLALWPNLEPIAYGLMSNFVISRSPVQSRRVAPEFLFSMAYMYMTRGEPTPSKANLTD